MTTPQLITHIENYLGPITQGHKDENTPYQVIKCEQSPHLEAKAYITLGLSNHELESPHNHPTRQELLIVSNSADVEPTIPSLLHHIADTILQDHTGITHGELIGPFKALQDNPIDGNSPIVAFYAYPPIYYPDNFSACSLSNSKDVEIVWLIPSTLEEVNYIEIHGAKAFENLLQEHGPDLTDFWRGTLTLPRQRK